jgi:Cu(I)/Ag(I) efflux system membrane fusion protein
VRAHVAVPNPLGRILPGLQAWVTLALPARHAEVAVPPGALLRSSRHTMAWVRTGRETYAPRRVETGIETPEAVEILSGIRAGEAVVVSGAYLLDSEWSYRQGGAKAHAGH